MMLRCPCGRADEFREPFWSPLKRLDRSHLHGFDGVLYRTEHRRCKAIKYLTEQAAKAILAGQREARTHIIRAS